MKKENERREFPDEMIEACGYAQIPNPVLWREIDISYPAKIVLMYMLSQPMDWVFYESKIQQDTGISKSTINNAINKELPEFIDKMYVGTGRFGNGFVVNFSKLYQKCLELGVHRKNSRSIENTDSSLINDFVRKKNSVVLKKDDGVRKTTTTNTETNTNNQYYYTNLSQVSDFQSLVFKEDASPCGSRQLNKTEESDLPVEEDILPVEENREEEIKKMIETVCPDGDLSHQTDEQLDTAKYAAHIVNSLFGEKHYAPNVREQCRIKLLSKPASELCMVIENHSKWINWCQNISPDQGVKKAQNSDYGLPLFTTDFIYSEYIKYLNTEKAQKKLADKMKQEEETRQEQIRQREKKIARRHEYIENMSYEEKLSILKSFRFDLTDKYKREFDVERIAKNNELYNDNEYVDLYSILAKKCKPEFYTGREQFMTRYTELMNKSDSEVKKELRLFNFSKIQMDYGLRMDQVIDAVTTKREINGDYDLIHKIVFHEFNDDYYKTEKKELDISKEFEDALLKSLNDDD